VYIDMCVRLSSTQDWKAPESHCCCPWDGWDHILAAPVDDCCSTAVSFVWIRKTYDDFSL